MALMTKEGLHKLKNAYAALKIEEKNAIDDVALARSYGDFSENAELDAANAKLERTRKRMVEIEQAFVEIVIFDVSTIDKNKVNFGAQVSIEELITQKQSVYKIVSEMESSVNDGRISVTSPLAKSMLGKKIGDECVFKAPNGERIFTINQIDYSWIE